MADPKPRSIRSLWPYVLILLSVVGAFGCEITPPAFAATPVVGGSSTATVHVAHAPRPRVSSVSPDSGPVSGGQHITINGTGFVNGAIVEIGQGHGPGPTSIVATQVIVVSRRKVTATTGGSAKSGTWNLFVITVGGASRSSVEDRYHYKTHNA